MESFCNKSAPYKLKKRFHCRHFSVKLVKLFIIAFLQNASGRRFLPVVISHRFYSYIEKKLSRLMKLIQQPFPRKITDIFVERIFDETESNFIEITLWNGCSPVNLLKFYKNSIYQCCFFIS